MTLAALGVGLTAEELATASAIAAGAGDSAAIGLPAVVGADVAGADVAGAGLLDAAGTAGFAESGGDLAAGTTAGVAGGAAAGGGGLGGLIPESLQEALGVASGLGAPGQVLDAGQSFASGDPGQGFLDAAQAALGVAGIPGSDLGTPFGADPDVLQANLSPLYNAAGEGSLYGAIPGSATDIIGPGGVFQGGEQIFNPGTNTLDTTDPIQQSVVENIFKGDPSFNVATTAETGVDEFGNAINTTTDSTLTNPDYVAPTPDAAGATPSVPSAPPPVPITPVSGGLEGVGAAPGTGLGAATGGGGGAQGLAGSLSGTAINPTSTPPLDTGIGTAGSGGTPGGGGGSPALDINASPVDGGASPAIDPSGGATAPITGVRGDAGAVAPQLGDMTGGVQLGDAGGAAAAPTSSPAPIEDLGAGGFGGASEPADLPPAPADYAGGVSGGGGGGEEAAGLLNDPGNVALAGLNGSTGQSLFAGFEGGGGPAVGDDAINMGGPGAGDDAITPPSFNSIYGPQQPLTAPDVPGPQTTVTDPSAFTPGGSSDSFLESLGIGGGLGDIGAFLKGNSNIIMPAVGLGAAGLKQLLTPAVPNQSALTGDAAQLQSLFNQFNPSNPASPANSPTQGLVTSAANALIPAEQTGQLAAGQQSIVDQALQDQITTLKSQAATRGESADPALNTGLAQQIAAAQNQATEISANMAAQETQTGLAAANQVAQTALGYTSAALQSVGLSAQIYEQLAALQLQQDAGLQQAITGFSTAAGYGAGAAALKQGLTTTTTV